MKIFRKFVVDFKKYDAKQVGTLNDQLFAVSENDETIGRIDKLRGHMNEYIENGLPHRAFSVFVFNEKKELLLQQRSEKKITFPMYWTNSCCSHPILNDNVDGVVDEAKQRTLFELNLDLNLKASQLELISKVLYKAKYDEHWGEYELDYLIFTKVTQILEINFNRDEVNAVQWLDLNQVKKFVSENKENITPWFHRIVTQTHFLDWWEKFCNPKEKNFWDFSSVIRLSGD